MTMAWRLFNRAVFSGEGAVTGSESTATAATATETKVAPPALTTTTMTDAAVAETKATESKAALPDAKAIGDARAWLMANTKDGESDAGKALLAGKTDEEALALAKAGQDAAAKAAADAPIVYTDFKLPDGVEVDAPTLDAAKALFAESKLPQEQAQKFVDFYQDKVTAAMQAPVKAWLDLNEQWTKDFKADKEIGGDRIKDTVAATAKAMRKFGTPALHDALIMTGAGNHPEVIRFFARVGAASGEDSHVPSNPTTAAKSTAEVMFPTMVKE